MKDPLIRRGVIDRGDLEHVKRLGLNPIGAEPAPLGGRGKINPHVTRFYTLDGQVTDVFHTKPVYYEAKDHTWRPMSEVASYHGNKNIVLKPRWADNMSQRYFQWLTKRQRLFPGKQLSIDTSLGFILQPEYYEYATDSTFYPDPSPETTTVDGLIQGRSNVWSTARGASPTNIGARDTSTSDEFIHTGYDPGGFGGYSYTLNRTFTLFDTSSIADGDTISAAVISIYVGSDLAGGNVTIQGCNLATNTVVATTDWSSMTVNSPTEFITRVNISALTNNAYNDFTLNADGRANISKTGVSEFCWRDGTHDVDNSAPTDNNTYFDARFADYAGTTSDPKLVVTHAAASGPASLKTWDTVAKSSVKSINGVLLASVKSVNTIT